MRLGPSYLNSRCHLTTRCHLTEKSIFNRHFSNKDNFLWSIAKASSEEVQKIDHSLMQYNALRLNYHISPPWAEMHYVLKDKDNIIIGGIESYLMMNSVLNISVLFVEEKFREKGFGSLLLNKAETEAKALGAYIAKLDTFDFQRGFNFYKKHGYEVFGTLRDSPTKGYTQYYMKKDLLNHNLTKGTFFWVKT